MKVFTLGYQGLDLSGYIRELVKVGSGVILDVRERAWSNRPDFVKTADSARPSPGRSEEFERFEVPLKPLFQTVCGFGFFRSYRHRWRASKIELTPVY